jgi:hypothetical protein
MAGENPVKTKAVEAAIAENLVIFVISITPFSADPIARNLPLYPI